MQIDCKDSGFKTSFLTHLVPYSCLCDACSNTLSRCTEIVKNIILKTFSTFVITAISGLYIKTFVANREAWNELQACY